MSAKLVAFSAIVASATAFAPGASFQPRLRTAGVSSVSMKMDKSGKAPVITVFDHRGCQRGTPDKEYRGKKAPMTRCASRCSLPRSLCPRPPPIASSSSLSRFCTASKRVIFGCVLRDVFSKPFQPAVLVGRVLRRYSSECSRSIESSLLRTLLNDVSLKISRLDFVYSALHGDFFVIYTVYLVEPSSSLFRRSSST
jgi:hypothetical protein